MRTLAAVSMLALLTACSKPAESDKTGTPNASAADSSKSKVIAKGEAYREADYKVPGKIVLLDFYADW